MTATAQEHGVHYEPKQREHQTGDGCGEQDARSGLVRLRRKAPHIPGSQARAVDPHSRAKDYISLTKPEVLFLVLITTGLGCVMASESLNLLVLFHALIGTALVAGGTAALNHYLERAQRLPDAPHGHAAHCRPGG